MINLLFILINLFVISVYDVWKMAKSELIYWGYGDDSTTVPGFGFNKQASEAASLSQFALFYFYVISSAFLLFTWQIALINIVCIIFLHWCGVEDLLYFLFTRWIKLPAKYLMTHPQIKILGFNIPAILPWLGVSRKIGFITVPSIIGTILGRYVPGKKFVILGLLAIIFISILSVLL
jgi:hypothetical protein